MEGSNFKKGLVLALFVLFIGASVILSISGTAVENISYNPVSKSTTLYVGGTGEDNYTKIQDALDDARNGDTVYVYDDSAPYYENIYLSKSIKLIGEDRNTTIIDARGWDYVSFVSADEVYISNLNFQNGSVGIDIKSKYNNITANTITNNNDGIGLFSSNDNIISGNIITLNKNFGIDIGFSNRNTIKDNDISHNKGGIVIYTSNNNTIEFNNIKNNENGLIMSFLSFSIIKDNNISKNKNGVYFNYSICNKIKGNIISNNDKGMHALRSSTNIIKGNIINLNKENGIIIQASRFNLINKNIISKNYDGLNIIYYYDSEIYHFCWYNIILKNNFLNNNRDAFFLDSYYNSNRWIRNYWNKSQILPKLIFGKAIIDENECTWLNIDWRPAIKPHNI